MSTVTKKRPADSTGEKLADGEFNFTRRDFNSIAAMIYDDAGIALNETKTSLVYSRLTKRIRQLGLADFRAYCDLVASDKGRAERREMLSMLTTNFTRFFRENHHFEHLRNDVLPGLIGRARKGERIRLWSAGCSDGQEPYSIALTLLSAFPEVSKYDVKILATDIDPKMIAIGQAGVYDESAAETVPAALKKQWFSKVDSPRGKRCMVDDRLKRLITFRELNLHGTWPFRGPFQVIFCRNVVIYFDDVTQSHIWTRFAAMLEDQGHFFIGHSERVTGPAKDQFDNIGVTTYRLKGTQPR